MTGVNLLNIASTFFLFDEKQLGINLNANVSYQNKPFNMCHLGFKGVTVNMSVCMYLSFQTGCHNQHNMYI